MQTAGKQRARASDERREQNRHLNQAEKTESRLRRRRRLLFRFVWRLFRSLESRIEPEERESERGREGGKQENFRWQRRNVRLREWGVINLCCIQCSAVCGVGCVICRSTDMFPLGSSTLVEPLEEKSV